MNSEASSLNPLLALETKFGHFPPYEKESEQLYPEDAEDPTHWRTKARITYVTDIARAVTYEGLDENLAIIFLRNELTRMKVNLFAADEIEEYLISAFGNVSPKNAVRELAKAVTWYKDHIGEPNPPFWCNKAKADLWLAAIISGMCGRQFQFGCAIYPREFNLPSKMVVSRFTHAAMRNHFFEMTFKGIKGGWAHKFQLHRDYWDSWRYLEPATNTRIGDPRLFEEYITKDFSWLFMNNDAKDYLSQSSPR